MGFFKNAYRNVRKAYFDRLTTQGEWVLALETTTNNQEVKRSLYRLQNVNNLPKDYIRMWVPQGRDLPISLRIVQFYRSC